MQDVDLVATLGDVDHPELPCLLTDFELPYAAAHSLKGGGGRGRLSIRSGAISAHYRSPVEPLRCSFERPRGSRPATRSPSWTDSVSNRVQALQASMYLKEYSLSCPRWQALWPGELDQISSPLSQEQPLNCLDFAKVDQVRRLIIYRRISVLKEIGSRTFNPMVAGSNPCTAHQNQIGHIL